MKRVLVVGGANLDLTAVAPRLPERGETVLATEYRETPGGKAANIASAAAAWGAPVTFVGRVGNDAFGDALLAAWVASNVDVSHVQRDPAGTGLGIVFMDSAGRYETVVAPRANAALSEADVAALPEALWDEIGTLALALEAPLSATRAAAEAAAVRRLPVVLNAAPVEGMNGALWPLVSHLIVNEHEAAALAAMPIADTTDAARAAMALLRALTPERSMAVIVTIGAGGAVVARPGGDPVHVAAPRVLAIDTLGAGDTFVGVLSAELNAGRDLISAATNACAAGTCAVTVAGARASITPEHVRSLSSGVTKTMAAGGRPEGAPA